MDEYEYKEVESLTEREEVEDTDMILGFDANEGIQISAENLKAYVIHNISVSNKKLIIDI